MARNDGIDRISARNVNLNSSKIGNAERHNEREKESYNNPDIVAERTPLNIHFKAPTSSYKEDFEQMETQGLISTRGLKEDANLYGELIFDVNSAYFYNHGGYEFAKKFYEDAYKAAIKIVGGEQYILSAVMHADERNRAMSEALSEDVYHYHLHVIYIPVVEKQILWSKRCKDKSLIGTVKETIMQVSSSKKWLSKPVINEETGKPLLNSNGKPVLRKSYTVLQDDFFNYMKEAGYDDVERGERGSSEEHLTVTQFKVEKEKERLSAIETKIEKQEQALHKAEQKTKVQHKVTVSMQDIDAMGKNTLFGKTEFTKSEASELKELAKNGVKAKAEIFDLKQKLSQAGKDADIWKSRYEKLKEQTKDFLEVMKKAPEFVKGIIDRVLNSDLSSKKQHNIKKEKNIFR